MLKKLRRAFTITELVIVIAVIAILAAVLIPTFVNVTNKAKESADTQTVDHLNTILSAEETLNRAKPATMQEAIDQALAGGYKVENLTPTSTGYSIVWDSVSNRFALVDAKGEAVHTDAATKSVSGVGVWKITDDEAELQSAAYSYYLTAGYTGTEIAAKSGIDVSSLEQVVDITYVSDAEQTVVFNMNGGTLAVNAPKSNVSHYGDAECVNITEVAGNSYHEYGAVGEISLAKGRLVAEAGSSVNTVRVTAASAADVSVEISASSSVNAVAATSSAVAKALNSVVQVSGDTSPVILDTTVSASLPPYAVSGFGTEQFPYIWMGAGLDEHLSGKKADGTQWNKQGLSAWIGSFDATVNTVYIKLGCDVEGKNSSPSVAAITINGFTLVLDLAGHTFTGTYGRCVFYVQSTGQLIINDSVGGGKVEYHSTRPNSGSGLIYLYAKSGETPNVTVNGGTYEVASLAENRYDPVPAVYISGDGVSTVTINEGNFKTCVCAGNSGNACILMNSKNAASKITINGGYFETVGEYNGTHFVLNMQDNSAGSILICGGTFKSYVPGGTNTGESDNITVAEGYTVQNNGDGTHTVVKA